MSAAEVCHADCLAALRAHALPLGMQTAAERAAIKIRAAVLTQIVDALPGITPEDAARLLKLTEHELQVTTHPDGSVSMTVSFIVTNRPTALGTNGAAS